MLGNMRITVEGLVKIIDRTQNKVLFDGKNAIN